MVNLISNFAFQFPYSWECVAWVINVTFFTILHHIIIENNSYRKSPKRKWWVAKAYKKRGSHTEEAAIPGYASSANFCQWSYCNLIVDMILCFLFFFFKRYYVFVSVVLYWYWNCPRGGDGAAQENRQHLSWILEECSTSVVVLGTIYLLHHAINLILFLFYFHDKIYYKAIT